MTGLSAIAGIAPDLLWHGFWVFLRIGGAFAVLPAFGERTVPMRVRLVLALAFTVIVAPAVDVPNRAPSAGEIVSELAVGLLFGLAVRLFVLALQTAGTIAAQSTSLAQLFAGGSTDPQPAISHFLVAGGLALAVMLGLHIQIAHYFLHSYDLIAPGALPLREDIADWAVSRVTQAFALSFSLAAPFAILGLVYNLALGAINKAMPQLMVAFVGAPAISAATLALLAISAPLLLALWQAQLATFLANPAGL